MKKQEHLHFIGICGVAMSALAIAFHKRGWQITGSDAGFYPPISTKLKEEGIDFYPGWHPELMIKDGAPDLVVVGNVANSSNPEWLYVQKSNLPYLSYPELIAKYFVRDHSIVCAGTYGKTTSAALMTWIMKNNGFDPSYMFGGVSLNHMDAAGLTTLPPSRGEREGGYSILEGDEYKTSRTDPRPKFAHYSPTHLLLTSVVWDHADVYPTAESYVQVFQKLYDAVPDTGRRIISEKAIEVIDTKSKPVVSYGQNSSNHYRYAEVRQSKTGVAFALLHEGKTYHLQTQTLGAFMADNITGCFALAHQIGIAPEKIITAIESFKGMKRRLEKRWADKITIFDDIAHSPSKAEAILNSLRSVYDGKIIAIFEPNTGNRKRVSIPSYDDAFTAADEVVIPRLTKVKTDVGDPDPPLDGAELAAVISHTHSQVKHIEADHDLIDHLLKTMKKDDVVVFLGSHGFRGMIEQLYKQIKN